MRKIEIAKYSVLLALNDACADMDEYYLYFLIPMLSYGCTRMDHVFGLMMLSNEIAFFFIEPTAGWLVDFFEKRQHQVVLWSFILQTLTSVTMVFSNYVAEPILKAPLLIFLWLIHQFFIQLNVTSIWKLVKTRCEFLYGKKDQKMQEQTIGTIGVTMEILSNAYETAFLLVCWGAMASNADFFWAQLIMWVSIFFGDAISIFVSLTITEASLTDFTGGVPHEDDDELDEEEKVPSPQEDTTLLRSTGTINASPSDNEVHEQSKARFAYEFLKERVLAFYYCRIALHAIIIAWILYTFGELVEYPVSFAEAHSSSKDCHKHHCDTNNYCGGNLTSLIQVSSYDNIGYVVGAFIYLFFLLKLSPKWFYSLVFPGVCLAMAALVGSFWWIGDMPSWLALALISVGVVVPTYMERYNFYFWAAVVDSKYFGFFYASFELGKNFLHMGISLTLTLIGDDMDTSSPEFSIMLVISMVMLLVAFFHSYYFYYAHAHHLKKTS